MGQFFLLDDLYLDLILRGKKGFFLKLIELPCKLRMSLFDFYEIFIFLHQPVDQFFLFYHDASPLARN